MTQEHRPGRIPIEIRLGHRWSVLQATTTFVLMVIAAFLSSCIGGGIEDSDSETSDPATDISLPSPWTETATPSSSSTGTPYPEATQEVSATTAVPATETATPTSTVEPLVRIGLSLIGGISADNYYFHVSMVDNESPFAPETVEIIDPTSSKTIGGPFDLAEKDSIYCRVTLYETEAVDSSELPVDFWYEFNVEPFYIFVITLRDSDGNVIVENVARRPGVCDSAAV